MKKNTSIFFLFLIISSNLFSQVTEEWVARYNGPGNYFDEAYAIIVDKLNNIIVVGYSYGFDKDFCTIKYNPNGQQLWVARYSGPNTWISRDVATCIALDSNNNIYVGGYSMGADTSLDICLVKYNSQGIQKWVRRYNSETNDDDEVNSLVVDAYGNIYLTGTLRVNSGFYDDIFTMKYDSNGVLLWGKKYDGTAHRSDIVRSINIDNEGNVYVAGGSMRSLPTWWDFILLKYNSNGDSQWVRTYDGPDNFYDVANTVLVSESGNLYISGTSEGGRFDYCTISYDKNGKERWLYRYDYQGFDDYHTSSVLDGNGNIIMTGYSTETVNYFFYCTVKVDSNGVQKWSKRFHWGGYYDFKARKVVADKDNNIYVTGEGGEGGSYYDYCTLKYDMNGNFIWKKYYDGPANEEDRGYAIALDDENNIYITGMSRGNEQYMNPDFATIKYSQPIGIQPISSEVPKHFSLSQNYPNPFNPVTKIKFDTPPLRTIGAFPSPKGREQWVRLVVYDILGREVATLVNEQLEPGTYEVEWNASNYPSGVYFYRLLINNEKIASRKMVLLK